MLSALFSVTFSKGRGIWKCERKSNYQIRVALILWRAYLDQTESFCNYHPPLCIGHQTFMLITTLLLSYPFMRPQSSPRPASLYHLQDTYLFINSSLLAKISKYYQGLCPRRVVAVCTLTFWLLSLDTASLVLPQAARSVPLLAESIFSFVGI